jgi:similar to spore coat protein
VEKIKLNKWSEVKEMRENLGVHESLELHELVTFKSLCLTKASIMQGLVTNPELKAIMQQDVTMTSRHIEELVNHLT